MSTQPQKPISETGAKASGLQKLEALVRQKFEALDQVHRRRRLRPMSEGLDLTHNDYLGLRSHPHFQSLAHKAAGAWPMGSGASRLLGGEHAIYAQLETQFSQWKACEASLYFPSGYAANEALIGALALGDVAFFSDALNHASLIDGLRLARIRPDQRQIFAHNDLQDLQQKLDLSPAAIKIVVTEALFSMDGDFAPLAEMAALCREIGALLLVDEAHSIGVYGPRGSGLAHDPSLMISINPCGKALGAAGAFVSGPAWLRELLINTARSFIYTTGASPWIAAGLNAGLALIIAADDSRCSLINTSADVRARLRDLGFDIGTSASHIIPIIIGSEAASLKAESFLRARGILARAIRPPTVPEGLCRLRLSLHSALRSTDVQILINAMEELSHEL